MIVNRLDILSENEAAYMAGLIDGDGCLYIGRQTNNPHSFRLGVKVTCKHKELCDWMHEHTGVGHVYRQRGSGHNEHRWYWRWEIYSHKDILKFLPRIAPYSVEKKQRCEMLYVMACHMRDNKGRALTDEVIEWREKFFSEFAKLQTHQVTANCGEFGENPIRTIPSQAGDEPEGVETRLEITATSAAPEREEIVRAIG